MKAAKRAFFVHGRERKPNSFHLWGAAFCIYWLLTGAAVAQDVITSPPATPATPAAVQEEQNNNPMQVFAPSETAPSVPLQLGPFNLHPHLDYQFSYGNGLQSAPGQSQDSIIQQLSPGMLINWGDHWTLDYTPTLAFYSSSSFQDTVNQSVQLSWGSRYDDWFLSGSQSYASSSNPDIETGAQTDTEIYTTALNATYQFNDKMSADLGFNQIFDYVGNGSTPTNYLQNLSNSKTWSTMDWLNYQFWPRFNVGLGIGGGYITQQGSPDVVYEEYQARVNWRATDKISFQLSGGANVQQYLSGGQDPLVTPIFSASIQYQPFSQTHLTVTASRTVTPASFQNQTTENDQIIGDLNQRLLGRFFLDLSGGYSTSKYQATVPGLPTSRNDDVYSFNARLSCPILKRGTVAVFYSYTDNSSNESGFTTGSGFGFTSHQVGFQLSYRY